MSREEVLAAIRDCAAELKCAPGLEDLKRMKKIGRGVIKRTFGTLAEAIRASGLKPKGIGYKVSTAELLLDWARVARQKRTLPSASTYTQAGHYSTGPFLGRASGKTCWQ
jgi:Homing endonuclease associated repeat